MSDSFFMEPGQNLYYWRSDERETVQDDLQKVISVLNAHLIALWEYDIQTKQCSFSDEYFHILGLDKLGIRYSDVEDSYRYIHPEDLPSYQAAFDEMLASEQKVAQIPYRMIGAYGAVVWLEDHFLSYRQSDHGHSTDKLMAYTVNLTSVREREQEIRRLDERNRKIVEALPEFIFIFDRNLLITDVMVPPSAALFHTEDELRGLDGRVLYSPEICDLLIANIHECLKDNCLKEVEYPVYLNGHQFYYQARMVPFEGDRVLALIHDITERVVRSKELAEAKWKAEESDRMKTLFLANMSHEIRTPLNAIVGFAEMLPYAENDDEQKEYLEIIRKNSGLLLQLIDDILDLSRIESGKSEMHFGFVLVSSLLNDIAKVHQLKMPDGVRLEVKHLDEDIQICTDRNRMTQVLSNFMSNAIKNTSKGCITLGAEKKGREVRLYVTDTGCGIAADKLPKIFQRFEKLNDFVQGTGLGLPICKSIVERLGGQIEVESELGVGSTFSVRLSPDIHLVSPQITVEAKKVLIVEESEVAYLQTAGLLKKDYAVLWARNEEEALAYFRHDAPHLVVVNMAIPGLNAIQVVGEIRQLSADIPIVAIMEDEQQQQLKTECEGFNLLPTSWDKLKDRVDYSLKESTPS